MKFILLLVCIIGFASSMELFSQQAPAATPTQAANNNPVDSSKKPTPSTKTKSWLKFNPPATMVKPTGTWVPINERKPTPQGPIKYEWDTKLPLNIQTQEGKFFKILIKGNITTGYNWYLQNGKDNQIVSALNLEKDGATNEYVTDKADKGKLGAGGVHIFSFRAKKSGKTELLFIHKGPREDDRMVKRAAHRVYITVK